MEVIQGRGHIARRDLCQTHAVVQVCVIGGCGQRHFDFSAHTGHPRRDGGCPLAALQSAASGKPAFQPVQHGRDLRASVILARRDRVEHGIAFGTPFVSQGTVGIFRKVRAADGEVRKRDVLAGRVIAHQMIPAVRQLADQVFAP